MIMPRQLKWTNDEIYKDALKYMTRTEWFKKSSRAYKYAAKRNILEMCCTHMRPPQQTWTESKILECSKKYNFRSDWWKYDKNSYNAARRFGILKKCSEHMVYKQNPYKNNLGIIYSYLFEDNTVYVGLSISPKKRFSNHLKYGPVSEKIKCGIKFQYNILESDISINDLPNKEIFYIKSFQNKGFILLNKREGGSLGTIGNKISNKDILNSALKYKHRNEWKLSEPNYYNAACRRKLLEESCKHMIYKRKYKNNRYGEILSQL